MQVGPLPDYKRQALEKRRSELMEEFKAANEQLSRELSVVNRKRIEREITDLEKQIAKIDEQLGDALAHTNPPRPEQHAPQEARHEMTSPRSLTTPILDNQQSNHNPSSSPATGSAKNTSSVPKTLPTPQTTGPRNAPGKSIIDQLRRYLFVQEISAQMTILGLLAMLSEAFQISPHILGWVGLGLSLSSGLIILVLSLKHDIKTTYDTNDRIATSFLVAVFAILWCTSALHLADRQFQQSISPEESVKEYYQLIASHEYRTAWDRLTPGFRMRVLDDDYNKYVAEWEAIGSACVERTQLITQDGMRAIVEVGIKYKYPTGAYDVHRARIQLTWLPEKRLWALDAYSQALTPIQAVEYYYKQINEGNYAESWGRLSETFDKISDFESYVTWWEEVDQVVINNLELIAEDPDYAVVLANIQYIMRDDGRVVSDNAPKIILEFNHQLGVWLILEKTAFE